MKLAWRQLHGWWKSSTDSTGQSKAVPPWGSAGRGSSGQHQAPFSRAQGVVWWTLVATMHAVHCDAAERGQARAWHLLPSTQQAGSLCPPPCTSWVLSDPLQVLHVTLPPQPSGLFVQSYSYPSLLCPAIPHLHTEFPATWARTREQ